MVDKYRKTPRTKLSDSHHIYCARANIKLCEFSAAKEHLEQVSYGHISYEYTNTKDLLKVLQNKQDSLFIKT